jgi:DNA helicase-2/ATP-dependent DNA helicase PcrA
MDDASLHQEGSRMDIKMTAADRVKECLSDVRHFVLQGGAGSGKTETLKEVLEFVAENHAEKTLICITHTNKAVNEINLRIDGAFPVSTIHSFLHSLIAAYRIDIHKVIFEIFKVSLFQEGAVANFLSEKDFLKDEFERFKLAHGRYCKRQFGFDKAKTPKHVGKKEYDKDRNKYNSELNEFIAKLNVGIKAHIDSKDPYSIEYNQRKFDSLRSLSYGHDSLITIAGLLLNGSAVLRKIVADRFNYIFIDEYQDTSPEIIQVLVKLMAKEKNLVIGLFGDSMQGIYESGIGDVDQYVADGTLLKIEKEDNFRCSQQVVDFLNPLRLDKMDQQVAFKSLNGILETFANRQGEVRGYYAVYENKPNAFSEREEKEKYATALSKLITIAGGAKDQKILMLTNKAIAADAGFKKLFDIFSDRYGIDLGEQIEKTLGVLQFDELIELCVLFQNNNYNELIARLRGNGLALVKSSDKLTISDKLKEIISSKNSAMHVLNTAFDTGLLIRDDSHADYLEYATRFLEDLGKDEQFQKFRKDFFSGMTTPKKMVDSGREMDEYLFDELERKIKKEGFFTKLLGDDLPFEDLMNYFDYLAENKNYITMHKTKGTGIENVLVVLEEFFWNKYNFFDVFSDPNGTDPSSTKNRKLVYVACSRAIKRLTCLRLVSPDEEKSFTKAFPQVVKISMDALS